MIAVELARMPSRYRLDAGLVPVEGIIHSRVENATIYLPHRFCIRHDSPRR